jgi:hypothetical protein
MMVIFKVLEDDWLVLLITFLVIAVCLYIRRRYNFVQGKLKEVDAKLVLPLKPMRELPCIHLEPDQPTAVFFIAESRGLGIHTLLNALRLFPDHFRNFIFVSAGIVDVQSFQGEESLVKMQKEVESVLNYFVDYCRQSGFCADKHAIYATEFISPIMKYVQELSKKFKDITFFVSELIVGDENGLTRLLDNEIPMILQRQIFALGKQVIILPMRIS